MIKLMKYEFLKKQRAIIISIAILAFMELGILFGIYKGENWIILAFILTFIMIAGVPLIVFVDSIRSYSSDLNQKQGYSLFLTPNSGYKIIGAKVIMSFIQLILSVSAVFVLVTLNFLFAMEVYSLELSNTIMPIIEAIKDVVVLPNFFQIFLLICTMAFEWFTVIMIAVLAITLTKTILSNKKMAWLISLIFFIVIYSIEQTISMAAFTSFGFVNDVMEMSQIVTPDTGSFMAYMFKYIGISAVLYPIYITVLFFLSGKLLNKRVDL